MAPWHYILAGLCCLLAVFMCRKEWQRAGKARLPSRMAASLLACAAFACLILPLTRRAAAAGLSGAKQAILLTEGFDKDSVGNFLRRTSDSIPVYVAGRSLLSAAGGYHPQYIGASGWPPPGQPFSAIHVFGYGMDKDGLQGLPVPLCVFHPSPVPDGIASVKWPERIKAGDELVVQGTFHNSSSSAVRVILSGYDTDLDTAFVPAKSDTTFSLRNTPKQLGKAVYSLRAVSGADVLEKEPVPFEVEQPGSLKIFILSASPDFETKFLKLWLSQNRYELLTRTSISKDKYEKTFINTPRISFGSITPSLLRDVDVLVADLGALAALGRPESAAIEAQVAEKGMGLIVRGDSNAAGNTFYTRPFTVVQEAGQEQKTVYLRIPAGNQPVAALNMEHPVYIRQQPGTQALVADRQFNTLVSSSIYGSGKLIYTTVNNTASWMLAGDNADYQAFWSYLFGKAAAHAGTERSWNIATAFPRVDRPVDIEYASDRPESLKMQVGENFVWLAQNPGLPFQWRASYWPRRMGWQPAMMENQTFWWYAYGAEDWKTVSAVQKMERTRRRMSAGSLEAAPAGQQAIPAQVPVPKTLFLIVFLACMGYLWLENKL